MNPVLGVIGNMLGGNNTNNTVSNAQANSGGIGNILGLFNMLKRSSDPMQTLQSMAGTNPQIQKAMDYVKQSGGGMQSAFFKLAKEKGVDPNQVLNLLK